MCSSVSKWLFKFDINECAAENPGRSIASYAIDFAGPMRSLNTLNSIENNQNIVWNKGVCSPIKETCSYGTASNAGRLKFLENQTSSLRYFSG